MKTIKFITERREVVIFLAALQSLIFTDFYQYEGDTGEHYFKVEAVYALESSRGSKVVSYRLAETEFNRLKNLF